MKKYGECPYYIYYTNWDGFMIQYHKQNKTYEKMVNEWNNEGKLTGTHWKLINI